MATEKINVDEIISDINNVLSKHLVSIINKCNDDKDKCEKYILNIPIVKNLIECNDNLKESVGILERKNKFLNDNLSSLSKKYTELFFRTQKVKISASVNDLIIDKSNDKANIELVVNDKTSINNEQIDQKKIEEEIENTIKEQRKKIVVVDFNIDSDIKTEPINLFDMDGNSDDVSNGDDECDEEMSRNFAETILMAQMNAGTMDDGSESEDAEEDAVEEDADEDADEDAEEDAVEEDAEDADEDAGEDAEEDAVEEDADEDADEDAEDDDDEDAEDDDDEDAEEEEVEEIEYDGVNYYASENKVGNIYEILEDEEIGEVVGNYVNGQPIIF